MILIVVKEFTNARNTICWRIRYYFSHGCFDYDVSIKVNKINWDNTVRENRERNTKIQLQTPILSILGILYYRNDKTTLYILSMAYKMCLFLRQSSDCKFIDNTRNQRSSSKASTMNAQHYYYVLVTLKSLQLLDLPSHLN